MSESGELWNTKITRRNVAAQVVGESKTGTYATPHMEERRRRRNVGLLLTGLVSVATCQEAPMFTVTVDAPSVIGHHAVLHWTANNNNNNNNKK